MKSAARRYKPLETKARILDAARTLFHDKGYLNASTLDIAQAAGVAEGSVFYHFGSKTKLLAALGAEYARDHVQAMHCGETDLTRLEPGILIARTFDYVRKHGLAAKPTGLPFNSPELQPFLLASRAIVVDFVAQCILCGDARGENAAPDEETARISATLSHAVVSEAIRSVFETEPPADEAKVLAETIRFVRAACGYGHLTGVPSTDVPPENLTASPERTQ